MGVPTLEATHSWDGGAVVLNDRSPLSPTFRARYWCDAIDLRGMADPLMPFDPVVGGTGAIPRTGSRGGKTVTYEGRIEALSAADLRDATDLLEAAFWTLDAAEKRMDVASYQPVDYFYRGRGTVSVKDDPQPLNTVPTPYQSSFVVAIQLGDPRLYETVQDTSITATFYPPLGLTLPYPRLPLPFIPGELDQFKRFAFTSTGQVPAPLKIVFHGQITTPIVYDVGRDVSLGLDVGIPAGETVTVDLGAGTITRASDGADLRGALIWPGSDLWENANRDLPPGAHTFQIYGDVVSFGASVDFLYFPAHP